LTALQSPLPDLRSEPRIYLASPLTALPAPARRQIGSDIATIKRAVERETVSDRLDSESWPVSIYAPFDHSAPWKTDNLSASQVYEKNLDAVHDSDALIVLAEKGGSAGVGQEFEWAIRLGIPILYLTAERDVSRQIAGAPAFVSAQSYSNDAETLENHVRNFLRRWRPMVLDGPRRRESRQIRFEAITDRLRGAWQNCPNPTEVAAQVRVDVQYLQLALSDPRYVAVMAVDTLLALAHNLDVPLTTLDPTPTFVLPVPMLRALMTTAAEDGWHDNTINQLLIEGKAALESARPFNLTTMSGWRRLHASLNP